MTDPELLRIGYGGIVPVQWTVEKSDDPGTLTGWASVYNVVDQQDDIVIAGAFRRFLNSWRAGKRTIPLTLDHENTANGVIGSLSKAEDAAYGLKTTFTFASTPDAQNARTKAREGHLNGLSIFGPIFQKAYDTVAGKSVRLLREVGLTSVGLTPIPANEGALVLTAKADDYAMKPLRACQENGKPGWKWGDSGTCYTYTPGDDASEMAARKKAMAQAAAMGAFPGTGGKSLEYDEFSDAMRQALSIGYPAAQKAAVHILLGSYRTPVETTTDGPITPEGTATVEAAEKTDDAAAYALDLVGMTGPDESPPDGDPTVSLAESLISSLDVANGIAKTSSDLDLLAEQIGKELGRE